MPTFLAKEVSSLENKVPPLKIEEGSVISAPLAILLQEHISTLGKLPIDKKYEVPKKINQELLPRIAADLKELNSELDPQEVLEVLFNPEAVKQIIDIFYKEEEKPTLTIPDTDYGIQYIDSLMQNGFDPATIPQDIAYTLRLGKTAGITKPGFIIELSPSDVKQIVPINVGKQHYAYLGLIRLTNQIPPSGIKLQRVIAPDDKKIQAIGDEARELLSKHPSLKK